MKRLLPTLFFLLCACSFTHHGMRPDVVPSPDTTAVPIPFDPAVVIGRLDNGLSYYVRENRKPEKRVELRLVVNAGSVLEDEDQRGLAHFVEHMAFNGTEHFEKQELVDYLEKIGMRFGPDINAYTSFDETVYMLEVPTDETEIVSTAFQILEDWAHRLTFDPNEVEKERGVVIEEWRQGRGASGRIRDKQFPVLFHDSRYAQRLPIGEKSILDSARVASLERFYRDWYRPDLMAVVVVGDLDPKQAEALIRQHFGGIEAPARLRPRTVFAIPGHEETLTSIVTDEEATSIGVTVGFKRPRSQDATLAGLRENLIDDIYDTLMIARLTELTKRADPPFQYGFAASGPLGRTKSIYRLVAGVRDGGVERGLMTLLQEAERVERYGFTPSELERAKIRFLRQIDRLLAESDKQESSHFAALYVNHFLEGHPEPSIAFFHAAVNDLIPEITLAEINARAEQWITPDNRVILVSGPDSESAGIPKEEAILGLFETARTANLEPWVDEVRDAPLVESVPEPGTVEKEAVFDAIGVTRWELSNGAVVLLKPTDFQNDEILLRGYRWGGHSLASDEDYLSASFAATIVSEMGVGEFSQIELGKALTGKVVSARPWIGELSEGISGGASRQDLETLFQLLFLRFTAARTDEEAFQAFMVTTKGWLENQESSPGYWFRKTMTEVLYGDHPRRRTLTPERLGTIDLESAIEHYRERFDGGTDFTFTLVGNFSIEEIRPLVLTWLGGLPSARGHHSFRDIGVRRPEGVESFVVNRGIEEKASVQIIFHGGAEWSILEDSLISSLASALRIRLREVLREDMGGVYGVGVSGSIERYPHGEYTFSIGFGCDPSRVEELVNAALEEIDRFRSFGPDAGTVEKVRENRNRGFETNLERNEFWVGALEYFVTNGLDASEILQFPTRTEAVTVETMRTMAGKYLDPRRYVQGILMPGG